MTEDSKTLTEATKIVRNHMLGSVAAGIVPIPLLDVVLVGGVQVHMIRRLAEHYGTEYSEQRVKAILAVVAGIGVAMTAGGTLSMLMPKQFKFIAGIGALTAPPAVTYALGQLFIKHFESGGTIWTFDAERAKPDYDKELEAGRKVVEESYAGVKP